MSYIKEGIAIQHKFLILHKKWDSEAAKHEVMLFQSGKKIMLDNPCITTDTIHSNYVLW